MRVNSELNIKRTTKKLQVRANNADTTATLARKGGVKGLNSYINIMEHIKPYASLIAVIGECMSPKIE